MGSNTSKAKRPTKAVVIPRIPQDVIDEILDHLSLDFSSLRSCALVSKPWVPSCRRHLFHTISLAPMHRAKWLETFPVPEESPAHHVRDVHLSGTWDGAATDQFFEHIRFMNVEGVALFGLGAFQQPWIPLLRELSPSVISLTLCAERVTLAQIRDAMVQLSNLDNVWLSGSLAVMDRGTLLGVGTVLRGRFGGHLRLPEGLAHEDVINMLLEVPTGLHFTSMRIDMAY